MGAARPHAWADAYHLLAVVLGRTREGIAEGLQLVQKARELAPGREAFLLTPAYLHANQQDVAAARALTRALESRATDADLRTRARELDQQLARFAEQQKMAAAATAAPGGPGTGTGASPALAATAPAAPVTTPVLRDVQTGELRVTGHLLAIECGADGARLHVDDKGARLGGSRGCGGVRTEVRSGSHPDASRLRAHFPAPGPSVSARAAAMSCAPVCGLRSRPEMPRW